MGSKRFGLYFGAVVLFSSQLFAATMLQFNPAIAQVQYQISDQTAGTVKVPKGSANIRGSCKATIVFKQLSQNTLEVSIPKIYSKVSIGKGINKQQYFLDSSGDKMTRGFEGKFPKLLKQLSLQKMVFVSQPNGKIIEQTGTLELLQKARSSKKNALPEALTLAPINQFFSQLYHLAGEKIAAKKYRLPVASFFNGLKSSKKARPISYILKKPKGKRYHATVNGRHKVTQRGATHNVSVRGTVSWDAKNAYLQKRHLTFKNATKFKKTRVTLRTEELWSSKKLRNTAPPKGQNAPAYTPAAPQLLVR